MTLETAKQYLRVDSADEDALIERMLDSSKKICLDILRTDDEEILDKPGVDIALLYALAYMYEHREEADYSVMQITLRHLLGADRKEVF